MPSWNWLNLNRTQFPASAFPRRADTYVCDKCGADLTKYLRPHSGHGWAPYGTERYVCTCGTCYLTGAMEWDNLGPRQRRSRLVSLLGTSLVFFVVFWIYALPAGLIAYFMLRTVKAGLVVGLVVAIVPALVIPILEVSGILRSIIRTRFRSAGQAADVRS